MSFESSYSLEATVFSYLAAFDDWRVCLSHFVAKGRGEWLMSRVSLAQVFCLACLGVAVAACSEEVGCENTCIDESTLKVCGSDVVVPCAAGCFEGACRVCADGAMKCEQGVAYTCRDGVWLEREKCDQGCAGFACKSACVDGAKKCEQGAAYTCREGEWVELAQCADGCDGDVCRSCREGERKCAYDAELECRAGAWTIAQTCSLGCGSASCRVCQDGAVKCESDAVWTCTNDAWQETSACDAGCLGGACRVCAEGAAKCESNGEYRCDGNAWVKIRDCEMGCGGDHCSGDANHNGLRDEFETATDQGTPCRKYADCEQFCDSAIGYVCSTKCTSDAQCIDGYLCRSDGRCSPEAFETVWEVGETDRIVDFPVQYLRACDFRIEWGDGTAPEAHTSCPNELKHEYAEAGQYRVRITGVIDGWTMCDGLSIGINNNANCWQSSCSNKLKEIASFGPVKMGRAVFSQCKTPIKMPLNDVPNAESLEYMDRYFDSALVSGPIDHWDVSHALSFERIFEK